MLIKTSAERDAFVALNNELMTHVPQHMTHVHRHEKIKDSFVLVDEAIPLPRVETVMAWRKLFRGWFPYPMIQVPEHASVLSAIDPKVYGFDHIEVPTHVNALSVLYGSVPGKFESGFDEMTPQAQVLHMLATSGLHLMSMNPAYQAAMRPLVKLHHNEFLIGLTFVITSQDFCFSWARAYDDSYVAWGQYASQKGA